MFFKLDERLARRKSITLPIGDFLLHNGLPSPKIWQWAQCFFAKPFTCPCDEAGPLAQTKPNLPADASVFFVEHGLN